MSLKIGIVGLPNVGKSTLFQALTRAQVDTSNYPFATIEPNIGIVEVEDPRVNILANLMHSKKRIPAVIEFVDIAGLVKGASEGEGLGNKFLAHIREVDAIVQVVRSFEDANIVHVESSINPERDRDIIETELFMADLATVEKAVTRLEKEARLDSARQAKSGSDEIKKQLEMARQVVGHLKAGERAPATLTEAEFARELQLLTAKPILYLYNTKEEDQKNDDPNKFFLNIKLEEELSGMTPEERSELGITPHINELAGKAYSLLGLMSFFTTGEDETRAWTIPKNSTARRAGRAIHSDFEEKFIRAEVIFWKDLVDAGSYAKAREHGTVRIEGKEYIVKDGEVIEFKI
ncbi:MAG: redox-regulated ATPase YchF [Patescibacteria group bacterium]